MKTPRYPGFTLHEITSPRARRRWAATVPRAWLVAAFALGVVVGALLAVLLREGLPC